MLVLRVTMCCVCVCLWACRHVRRHGESERARVCEWCEWVGGSVGGWLCVQHRCTTLAQALTHHLTWRTSTHHPTASRQEACRLSGRAHCRGSAWGHGQQQRCRNVVMPVRTWSRTCRAAAQRRPLPRLPERQVEEVLCRKAWAHVNGGRDAPWKARPMPWPQKYGTTDRPRDNASLWVCTGGGGGVRVSARTSVRVYVYV